MRLPNKFRLGKSPETSAEEQRVHSHNSQSIIQGRMEPVCVQIMVWDQYWVCACVRLLKYAPLGKTAALCKESSV